MKESTGKNKKSILAWIWRHTKKRTFLLLLLTSSNMLFAYMGVQIALQTKTVLDIATAQEFRKEAFISACIVLVACTLSLLILRFISTQLQQYLVMVLDRDLKKELFHKLLAGNFAEVHAYHSGELVNRLSSDIGTVSSGMTSVIPSLMSTLTRLVSAAIVLFSLEPWLTVVLIVAGILFMLATHFLRNRLKKLHKEVAASGGKVQGFFQESLEKLLLVQSMDVAPEMEKRADRLIGERFFLQRKQKNIASLGMSGTMFIMDVLRYGSILFCAIRLMGGQITVGTLTAITQLVGQIEGPLQNLSSILNQYVSALGSAERLAELTQIGETGEETVPADSVYEKMSGIVARDLTFTYPDEEEPAIYRRSFEIRKGKFTAIAGESGAGKSTLFKLLLGIYPIQDGKLVLSSEEEIPVSRATRCLFSFVPQGNLLISGTLRENLCLTKPDATDEELMRALEIAELKEFVENLPKGLDTYLQESGAGISDGQAERLSLARALLRKAPILLLDEATASLDLPTEKKVLDNIRALKDITVIAITHRPYAKEIADDVLNWESEYE